MDLCPDIAPRTHIWLHFGLFSKTDSDEEIKFVGLVVHKWLLLINFLRSKAGFLPNIFPPPIIILHLHHLA